MILLLTLTLAGVVLGAPGLKPEKLCAATQWSGWGECGKTDMCQIPAISFPVPETKLDDEGRAMWKINMERKQAERDYVSKCRREGTCPEFDFKPSLTNSQSGWPCIDGLAADKFPCENVDLLSYLSFLDLGYNDNFEEWSTIQGNDVWGWVDEDDEDQEYALMGLSGGTSFVRITDPLNPVVLAFLPSHLHRARIWRDIKVVGHHAYIVSEASEHGMQIFDLSRLREWTSWQGWVAADGHYGGFGNAHNIVANEETEHVYAVGARETAGNYQPCEGGLHMVDVSDPDNPRMDGCYSQDGYSHDAECVVYHGPDTRYTDKEICFGYNENTLTIVDVTSHANPVMLSRTGYFESRYTHQGWITEDHRTVLLDDELDEMYTENDYTRTYMWDVSDLTDPKLVKVYQHPQKSIDHNQYILNDFAYQSNYESGLRIMDITHTGSVYDLHEVGYFDVLPESNDEVDFIGTWSNYPYYPSGTVAVSSIEDGLFLVRPNMPAMLKERANHTKGLKCRSSLPSEDDTGCPKYEYSACLL